MAVRGRARNRPVLWRWVCFRSGAHSRVLLPAVGLCGGWWCVRAGAVWGRGAAGTHLDGGDGSLERAPDAGARVNELSESRARAGGGPAEKRVSRCPRR